MTSPVSDAQDMPKVLQERHGQHIKDMDVQHERIATVMALVSQSMDASGEGLSLALDYLIAEVRSHFAEEEQFMRLCGFPGFDEHRLRHYEFVVHCEQIRSDWAVHRVPISAEMRALMAQWLQEHRESEDRHYREFTAPVL